MLLVNAVATAAAGITLFVRPELIAGVVGLHLPASANFIYYLLGGAEIGFSALCALALRLTDAAAIRTVSFVMITFHAASGVGGLLAYGQGLDAVVLGNVALRLLMVALFLIFGVIRAADWTRS